MFVRIVWSGKPGGTHQPRDWRGTRHLPRTGCDDLGVPAPDFARMTKSLFDKVQ